MTRLRTAAAAALCLMLLVASACTDKKAEPQAGGTSTPTITPSPTPTSVTPYPLNFDPSEFGPDSANITNEWWPLKPGTRWTWEGSAFDGDTRIKRKIVFTITDLTKDLAGVRTVVGLDLDYNDGKLVESELIFLAQDKAGNVKHFGETVEHYDEEGKYDGTRVWLVGYLEGAKSGVMMPANPHVGTPAYQQGFAPPPFNWNDFGRVAQAGQKTCVKAGCYTDVIVIEEFEPAYPDAFQLKYYARGIGQVRVGWRGKEETEKETLELVKVEQISPEELARVRTEALRMQTWANTYSLTPPLAPRSAATEPTTSPTGSPTA